MRKPTFALSCLLASAALAGCNRVETTSRPLPSGPNVVLITIDTLRADHLGATGSPRDTQTPTLDALAGEGVRFANAISTVPITLPSHTSILTGLYPPHHGVRHNSTFRAAPELETIAERFQATGYATRAVVAAKVLDARFGLAQGFDVYDEPAEGGERASAASFVERDAAAVTDAAIAQLAQVDRPFFLWAHYYDPHRDYAAPQRFRGRFPNDPYAAEVAYVDEQIARLVAALRERGSFDRTVIAVTSDHGEGLGEHGETDHAYLVYEATQHVPWILRGPGIPAGRVVDTVVSNAAVAATLAQLAGVGALARADVASAVPLWSESAARAESWAYSESLAGQLEYGWAPLYAIRRAGEKFIQAPGDELYDLARDPGELRNLLEAPSPKPDALQQVLMQLLGLACDGLPVHALAGGRRDAPAPLAVVFDPRAWAREPGLATLGGMVHAGLLLCLAGETAGLVFDARYRDFNTLAFVLPELACFGVFTERAGERPSPAIERPLAGMLVAAATVILFQETPLNLEADLWALLCALFAWSLWRNASGSRAPRLWALLAAAVGAYAAAAAVRYGLMEAPQFVGRCSGQAGDALCALRSAIGLMIHFRVFGWLGLVAAIAAVATGRAGLRIAAVILATGGLVLYNANLGIVAFVVVTVALARTVAVVDCPTRSA